VFFIGTQFSSLYTAVDTVQMRQPKPRDGVHDVYVFVCKCVLGSSRASQPLNILAYAFSSTSAFSLSLMPLRLAVGAASGFPGSSAPAPNRHPTGSSYSSKHGGPLISRHAPKMLRPHTHTHTLTHPPTHTPTNKLVCLFITAVPITKLSRGGRGIVEDMCYEMGPVRNPVL
jgi:hypothetical protein